jgi:hypothetical protein
MRTNFKEVAACLKARGIEIRRISKENPYGGYTTGYLVDDKVLYPRRWARLDDIWLNCCLDGRMSDGMMRRDAQ